MSSNASPMEATVDHAIRDPTEDQALRDPTEPPEFDGVLGHDFGSLYSKLALCFHNSTNNAQVSRVPFTGDIKDPDYPEGHSEYEFVAGAALDGTGELVEGQRATHQDQCIPLKTMLVYLALSQSRTINHCYQVVNLLPWGPVLLDAIRDAKLIRPEMIKRALTRHFQRLRRMALLQAGSNRVRIRTIVVTYPNYVFENEGSKDFDRFLDTYLSILLPVWGPDVKFRVTSEGQAVALYVCVPFFDTVRGTIRQQIKALFEGLDKTSYINLMIVDQGSSSMNIQSVCIWFDEDGNMRHHLSFIRSGQVAGAYGGSHNANESVRDIVTKSLNKGREKRIFDFPRGSLAEYLNDFDRKKKQRRFNYLDYVNEGKELSLHSDNGNQLRIDLTPRQIEKVFGKAFDTGLRIVKHEIKRTIKGARSDNNAYLFTGGSHLSTGLRAQVTDLMESYSNQTQAKGMKTNYKFLGNSDPNWASAVSIGAGLGVLTMPRLSTLLSGFTVGLHKIERRPSPSSTKTRWIGQSSASVLFSQGLGRPPHNDHTLSKHLASSNRVRFSLVCDPLYHADRGPGEQLSS
ncbi:hypothetical protein FJTKL_06330 [Diaporthe vaccinii]|uniref:Actin-like ATPase domain-containing protein n=2 Tax=Diaporthe vaccinii TaxID=105482 RepID=A0ABR4DQ73_9PEZI